MTDQGTPALSHRQIWKLIAVVMLVQVFAQFVRSWVFIQLRDDGMDERTAENLTYFIVIPFLLVMLYPVWQQHKGILLDRLRWSGLTLKTIVTGVLLGITLRVVGRAEMVAEGGFGFVRNPSPTAVVGPEISWSCPSFALMLLHFAAMGIAAPLAEEIVNRGWILHWLGRYGRVVAVAGSTFLFMIMHEPGTRAMVMPLIVGIFLGIYVLNSRSLWGAIIAHGTCNTMVIVDWLCLRYQWNPPETTTATVAAGVLATLTAVFALAFATLLVSRRIAGSRSDDSPMPR